MTLQEQSQLMNDPIFRDRVKAAMLHFAQFTADDTADTVCVNTRKQWARQAQTSPDQSAIQIQPSVVMDAAVQAAGSSIDDAALQSSVEATIKKMW